MARGLIAYVYVVPEGWAVDITQDSEDLVEQLIALMEMLGYTVPKKLLRLAGHREQRRAA